MTGHDNFHSALVAWLKVLLPLLALVILSMLFLVSRTIDPSDAIPFAEVDIEERLREPRLTLPTWAGVTEDGAALTVSAETARTVAETDARAERLVAKLDLPGGGDAELVAAEGHLNSNEQRLEMAGGVIMSTSTGYRIESAVMAARLDQTELSTNQPVLATAPMGQIEAESMTLIANPQQEGQYLLVFKGSVKLLYQPPE
ncbi:MAG: hypothetical protein ACK5M4_05290 [Pseudorhodobacter sp.]